jgi:hypothetical protein
MYILLFLTVRIHFIVQAISVLLINLLYILLFSIFTLLLYTTIYFLCLQANDFATMFVRLFAAMGQNPGFPVIPGFPHLSETPAPTSEPGFNRKQSGTSCGDISTTSPEAEKGEKKKPGKPRSVSAMVTGLQASSDIMIRYPLSEADIQVRIYSNMFAKFTDYTYYIKDIIYVFIQLL